MLRTVLAVCALLCAFTTNAEARPMHKDCNILWPCVAPSESTPDQVRTARGRYIAREVGFGGPVVRRAVRAPKVHPGAAGKPNKMRHKLAVPHQTSAAATGNSLVAQARAYLGTNPTGWRSLWCGRFMAMVAPAAAAKVKNPNYAKDWLQLPRTSGRVGDIAVMGRRGGGHVGVVSGFDSKGNPIIVSGNAGRSKGGSRTVHEGTYSRHRILAFVDAG